MMKRVFLIIAAVLLAAALALSIWALIVAYLPDDSPAGTADSDTQQTLRELLDAWESLVSDDGSMSDEEMVAKFEELLGSATLSANAHSVFESVSASTVSVLSYYPGSDTMNYGGSGFFISEDGLVATAYHVIAGAEEIRVRTSDKNTYTVSYIAGYDTALDIAILKIPLTGTTPVTAADVSAAESGDILYALGRNSGADFTYSSAILSNTGDVMSAYPRRRLIRYCNLTQKGSSGCAIFNEEGKALGMCQLQDSTYGTLQWAIEIAQVLGVPRDRMLTPSALAEEVALDLTHYLSYTQDGDGVHITGLKSTPTSKSAYTVRVPATINGKPVKSFSLADGASFGDTYRILLPEGIETLGRSFLSPGSKIRTVHIPSSVKTVTPDAFLGATALTEITTESTALRVTDGCLYSADGGTLYKLLSLPKDGVLSLAGVHTVGAQAARGKGVTALTDATSLAYIGEQAFYGSSLVSLSLPSSLSFLGEQAFASSKKLCVLTLAEGLTGLSRAAFKGCTELISVTLPQTLLRLDDEAFAGCKNLSALAIPASLAYVGDGAFRDSGLCMLTLPETVLYLGDEAFYGTKLTSVTLSALPYIPDLTVFGTAEQVADMTFRISAAIDVERLDTLWKTLFLLGVLEVY